MRPEISGVVALAFVTMMVAFFPAARVFLAFSIPLGALVALGLYYWNRRPVKLKDEDNKRPLGLD